jgi:hypothetical protein
MQVDIMVQQIRAAMRAAIQTPGLFADCHRKLCLGNAAYAYQ